MIFTFQLTVVQEREKSHFTAAHPTVLRKKRRQGMLRAADYMLFADVSLLIWITASVYG